MHTSRINAAIEVVRAAGGYVMIYDIGVPGSGIAGMDPSLDLTQAVIQGLVRSTG